MTQHWIPPPEDSPERQLLRRALRTARGRSAVLAACFWPLRTLITFATSPELLANTILDATEPLCTLSDGRNHARTLAGRVAVTEALLGRCDGAEGFDCSDLLTVVAQAKELLGRAKPTPAQAALAQWVVGVEI